MTKSESKEAISKVIREGIEKSALMRLERLFEAVTSLVTSRKRAVLSVAV